MSVLPTRRSRPAALHACTLSTSPRFPLWSFRIFPSGASYVREPKASPSVAGQGLSIHFAIRRSSGSFLQSYIRLRDHVLGQACRQMSCATPPPPYLLHPTRCFLGMCSTPPDACLQPCLPAPSPQRSATRHAQPAALQSLPAQPEIHESLLRIIPPHKTQSSRRLPSPQIPPSGTSALPHLRTNRSVRKRSAVTSGRFRYPRAIPALRCTTLPQRLPAPAPMPVQDVHSRVRYRSPNSAAPPTLRGCTHAWLRIQSLRSARKH